MDKLQLGWIKLGGVLLVILVLVGVKAWVVDRYVLSDRLPVHYIHCSPNPLLCALPGGGQVQFMTRPQYGKPFELMLRNLSLRQTPKVEFTMPDMDMGLNRYQFIKAGTTQKAWTASVILPACMSASHDWLATLTIEGKIYQLAFVVD